MELTVHDLREGDEVRLRVKRIKDPLEAIYRSKTLGGDFWFVELAGGNLYLAARDVEDIELINGDERWGEIVQRRRWEAWADSVREGAGERLVGAVHELLRLKDGARDEAYQAAKQPAWYELRAALAEFEEKVDGPSEA